MPIGEVVDSFPTDNYELDIINIVRKNKLKKIKVRNCPEFFQVTTNISYDITAFRPMEPKR